MGEHPAAARRGTGHEEYRPRRSGRPEISVPQLLGAALGAAAGMALASELRLYGTTAGAIVFAVAATAGTSLIQVALHRAGEGCTALLRAARNGRGTGGRPPVAGARRALAPVAVGLLLFGVVATSGTLAVAAPPHPALVQRHDPSPGHAPSPDPDPDQGQDKVVQARPEGRTSASRKSAARRAS